MPNKIELKQVSKAYRHNQPVIEQLDLNIEAGSFTVLLGPSGCGKSTILRMIAGLEQETSGQILIDQTSMKGVAAGDRNIAMVFQNYALYPTMTVRENMEFGLKNMKVPKDERHKRIQEISEIVGLTEYLDRKPGTLSGGQRQRIALARAIVKKPEVFLMDEPLSNLDAKLRSQLRTELIELHRRLKTTFVYVTHDQVEAMSMATQIVLLQNGKIMQQAAPQDIYHHPANLFTAQFIGSPPMNLLNEAAQKEFHRFLPANACHIGFRPEHVKPVNSEAPIPVDCLVIKGELATRELLGTEQLYLVSTACGQIYMKLYDAAQIEYGEVTLSINLKHLNFFDQYQQHIPSSKAGDMIS